MPLANYQRIILHAGLHKTGTSYIQKLLHVNRRSLAQAGIHFPQYHVGEKRRKTGNHSLAVKFFQRSDLSLEDALSEFLKLQSQHPVLLLSAEALARRIPVQRLAQELNSLANKVDVQIIYYLRRQDHLLESLFAETVKKHGYRKPAEVPYAFNYLELAESIEAAVPKAKIVLRPYNKKRWRHEDLGAEFFDAIEYPSLWDSLETKVIKRQNERRDRRETFLLSMSRTPQEKRELLVRLQRLPRTAERDSSHFLSPEERKAFLLSHAETNERLAERYGLGDWKDFLGVDLAAFADERWSPLDTSQDAYERYVAELSARTPPATRASPLDALFKSAQRWLKGTSTPGERRRSAP